MVHDPARPTKAADISIAAATYVAVGILASFISLSRWLSTRRAVAAIPKPYVPIERGDMPKRVHDMVSTEYSRCALALHVSQPRGRTLPGWGVAGTPFEGMRFRAAILGSVATLRTMLGPLDAAAIKSPHAASPRSSLLAPFLPALFDPPDPVLLPAHRPLIQLWDDHLERARWAATEPAQADFEEVLRLLAVVLAELTRKGRVPPALAELDAKAAGSRTTLSSGGG